MRARRPGPTAPIVALALVTIVGAGLCSCGMSEAERRRADPRPNVVIVSMDTTRADHLSTYGYARPTSPNLSQLAEQGVRFEEAYSTSATTGPSHASLFTSLHPITHGVAKNGNTLSSAFATLAGLLAGAGYETAAVVSSFVLDAQFGYASGFDVYDDDVSKASTPAGVRVWEGREVEGKFYGSADDTTRRALGWLKRREHADRPFFLFVHYFDPHEPYQPPPGYTPPFTPGRKAALKLERTIFFYDVLLAYTDHEIGRLIDNIDQMGLGPSTLVIVTGDHGEGLMEHGHMFHGVHIYEEGVRVPMIARWTGRLEAGRVVDGPAGLLDIAPTVLELAGVDVGAAGEAFRGESLALAMHGRADLDSQRPIFLYRRPYDGGEVAKGVHARGDKFGVRVGRWKLIEGPAEETMELFDLEADPGERHNLAEARPDIVAPLSLRIQQWRARDGRTAERPTLTEEDRARLEALGYVE